MEKKAELWKTATLVCTYLDGVRGGLPCAAEQIDVMLRLITAREKAVSRFADLGCGDGILASAVLSKYPAALGTLVDFSEPMLREAQAQLRDYEPKLRFIVADLSTKEWLQAVRNQAAFDVIVSGYAIHHLTDERKRELYREIFDILEPGGLFVNMDHVSSTTDWIQSISDHLHTDSLYAFHQQRGSAKSREQIANEYVHRPDQEANILAPVELQCEWLRECGFQDVDCYFKIFERAVFGGRRPNTLDPVGGLM